MKKAIIAISGALALLASVVAAPAATPHLDLSTPSIDLTEFGDVFPEALSDLQPTDTVGAAVLDHATTIDKKENKMTVKAKFWVSSIQHQSPASVECDQVANIELQPVFASGDGENADWSKYTPSGKIEMCITNPAAIEQFSLGQEYYLTFEAANPA